MTKHYRVYNFGNAANGLELIAYGKKGVSKGKLTLKKKKEMKWKKTKTVA